MDAGDVSLYYEESGAGRPVVFVHGIPTDFRAWQAQVGSFSNGRRAIVMSRRLAHPNRPKVDPMSSTVQNNAADLRTFMEKVVPGPADLVGHSYGAFVCAVLAAEHGDLVRSLVLVEPAVSTLLVADKSSALQLAGLLFREPAVALSARRFQSASLAPSIAALRAGRKAEAVELNVDGVQDRRGSFAAMPAQVKEMMLDNSATIAELETEFPRFTSQEAEKIKSPTLVINGEDSALWLRRIGELLAKHVPDSRRERIKDARHFPHMENPKDFNDVTLRFLKEAGT